VLTLVEFVDVLVLVKYVFKDISHLLYLTYFTYLLNEIAIYYEFLSVNPNLMCSGIFLSLHSLLLIDDSLVIQPLLI